MRNQTANNEQQKHGAPATGVETTFLMGTVVRRTNTEVPTVDAHEAVGNANARTLQHAHNYSLRGSNPRPMAHKTIALTTELREPTICPTTRKQKPRHQATMTPAGLEPAIPGSVGRCLIHWATGPSKSTSGIANNRKRNTKQPHHRRHQMIQTQCATATPSRQTHSKPARRKASATHCLFSLVGRAPAQ